MTMILSDEYTGGGATVADGYSIGGSILSVSPLASSLSITGLAVSNFSVTFFSGTMPTLTQMNTFLVSQGAALLQFVGNASNITKTSASKIIAINFGVTLGTIINQGTISWFHIGNTSASAYNYPQFFGTVGLAGSGADLILAKTTVTTGDLWLCTNLYFNVGTNHTHL